MGSPQRVLAVIDNVAATPGLARELLRFEREEGPDVRVVAPALNSPLQFWCSDEDGARAAASRRLEEVVRVLRTRLPKVEGAVGDPDPLLAIDDSLRGFAAEHVVIALGDPVHPHWLERDLLRRARSRLRCPVTQVAALPLQQS
jgi:hypothetical protein